MKQRKPEEITLIIVLLVLIVGIAGLLLYFNPLDTQVRAAANGANSWQAELPQIKVQGKVVSLLGTSQIMIQTKSGYRYLVEVGDARITNSNGRVLTYQNLKDFLKVDDRPEVTITGYVAPTSGTAISAVGQTVRFVKPVPTPTATPRITPTPRPTATPRPTPTKRPSPTPRLSITPWPAN